MNIRATQHNQRVRVEREIMREAQRRAWEGHMSLSGVVSAAVREVVAGRLASPAPPQTWGERERVTLTIHPDNWLTVQDGVLLDGWPFRADRAHLVALIVYAYAEKRLEVSYDVRQAAA